MLKFKDAIHKIDELLYSSSMLQHNEHVMNKYLLLDISTYTQLIKETKNLVTKRDETTKELINYYQGYVLYPVYINHTFIHVTFDNSFMYDELAED